MRVAGYWVLVAGLFAASAPATAQDVQTDPLRCWWRTSAGAVRVGEQFSTVLTCAVIDTPDVKVVVDEGRLDPSVAQFAPFEVTGGSHASDLQSGDRRFFQYEYRLRLVAENLFGKDVALPETKLTYRVQSRITQRQPGGSGRDESIAGRDQTYILPPMSLRLLSLVPADATDIRDASTETFADLDRRMFRASLFVVIGGVLFAIAALTAVLTLVRLLLRSRKPATAAERLVGDGAILRGVGRELAAVQRQRDDGVAWTADLAGRALAALRVVGTYALGRHASRTVVTATPAAGGGSAPPDRGLAVNGGRIVVSVGWPKTKRVAVFGSTTARTVTNAIKRSGNGKEPGELESIEEALARFTTAHYGRPGNAGAGSDGSAGSSGNGGEIAVDAAALDESLLAGQQLLRRLKIEQTWVMRRLGRNRKAIAAESQMWSH